MRTLFSKMKAAYYCALATVTVVLLFLLLSCGAGVDIGEANKVLTSFQIVWPGDFTNTCLSGVPVTVTINALDQNGEVFTSWGGIVTIEMDNTYVKPSYESADIKNGSKQIDISFAVAEEETVKMRVRYGETSSPWSATITVQKAFSIAAITPDDGSLLVGHQDIVITFNDNTDPGSLSIGGDLGGFIASWKDVTYKNDKLTLSPSGFWNDSGSRLTVTCSISGGGQSASKSVTYDVFHGVFVRLTNSDDSYNGTADEPKATIQGAIDGIMNDIGYSTAEVRVAEGTYNVNWNSNINRIVLQSGVSLYGGYSDTDWNLYNPSLYPTIIDDISIGGGTAADAPNRTIDCGSGVTSSTIIDGFTINGGDGGSYCTAIFNHDGASPVIQNNTIKGNKGTNHAMGIYNRNSSPLIQDNDLVEGGKEGTGCAIYNYYSSPTINTNIINGGESANFTNAIKNVASSPLICNNDIHAGDLAWETYAIWNTGTSNPKIYNNTISGGTGSNGSTGGTAYAIFNQSSSPFIKNNTIDGGIDGDMPAPHPYCIYNTGNSDPVIENNLLFIRSGSYGYGIYEADVNSDPASVKNNDIFNCPTALYYDEASSSKTISEVNNLDAAYSGNISQDAQLANKLGFDWHLGMSTPCVVSQGGLDLSGDTDFPEDAGGDKVDRDENKRDGSWSMGAYEYNGTCSF